MKWSGICTGGGRTGHANHTATAKQIYGSARKNFEPVAAVAGESGDMPCHERSVLHPMLFRLEIPEHAEQGDVEEHVDRGTEALIQECERLVQQQVDEDRE